MDIQYYLDRVLARLTFRCGGKSSQDEGMERRVDKLKNNVEAIKLDVATILSNYASKADIGDLRSDMHKATMRLQQWMIATLIGLFVGFGGLFIIMSNALKPPAPTVPATTAQPALIIIPIPTPAPAAATR
jgi:hypothetical protein